MRRYEKGARTSDAHARRFEWAVVLVAAAATVVGWHTFLFLTDDAHIAFRYVYNSMAGRGLVWNPAPFKPVEGYTSFLWVAGWSGR